MDIAIDNRSKRKRQSQELCLVFRQGKTAQSFPCSLREGRAGIQAKRRAVKSGCRYKSRATLVDEEEFRKVGLHGFVLLGALLALFLGVELQHHPSAFDALECHGDTSLSPPGQAPALGNRQEANHCLRESIDRKRQKGDVKLEEIREMDPRRKRAFILNIRPRLGKAREPHGTDGVDPLPDSFEMKKRPARRGARVWVKHSLMEAANLGSSWIIFSPSAFSTASR